MDHTDHVRLLKGGIESTGGVWADLGSGTGAFTLALADLLGPGGTIYSIDVDSRALKNQAQALHSRFPSTRLITVAADYTRPMDLPPLDGIVMANSLHFHRYKAVIVRGIRSYLRPDGRFILVEYNVDIGNPWVPHPISYPSWEKLAFECRFTHTHQLAAVPSRFLGEIYSAVSW